MANSVLLLVLIMFLKSASLWKNIVSLKFCWFFYLVLKRIFHSCTNISIVVSGTFVSTGVPFLNLPMNFESLDYDILSGPVFTARSTFWSCSALCVCKLWIISQRQLRCTSSFTKKTRSVSWKPLGHIHDMMRLPCASEHFQVMTRRCFQLRQEVPVSPPASGLERMVNKIHGFWTVKEEVPLYLHYCRTATVCCILHAFLTLVISMPYALETNHSSRPLISYFIFNNNIFLGSHTIPYPIVSLMMCNISFQGIIVSHFP